MAGAFSIEPRHFNRKPFIVRDARAAMAENDRPVLGIDIEFQIETAQNQIHASYWPQLEQLQETMQEDERASRDVHSTLRRLPPTPKRPQALRHVLYRYASALFESEATLYPNDSDNLAHWLAKLRRRVTERTLETVNEIEASGRSRNVSLNHHGVTGSDIRSTIEAALEEQTEARLVAAATEQIKARLATVQQEAIAAANQKPALTMTQPEPQPTSVTRKAFVEPILLEKGWSILEWANEAEVAYNTVANYLAGKKNPYRSTRVKLARALGVPPNQLPL